MIWCICTFDDHLLRILIEHYLAWICRTSQVSPWLYTITTSNKSSSSWDVATLLSLIIVVVINWFLTLSYGFGIKSESSKCNECLSSNFKPINFLPCHIIPLGLLSFHHGPHDIAGLITVNFDIKYFLVTDPNFSINYDVHWGLFKVKFLGWLQVDQSHARRDFDHPFEKKLPCYLCIVEEQFIERIL